MLDYFPSATSEKPYDLIYIFIVFLLGNASYAASETFPDMEIKTGTDLTAKDHIRGNPMFAGTQRVYIVEEFHEIPRMNHAAIRAEIP